MPMLPGFIGPSYQAEALAQNAQRCVNLYLEQDPTGKQPAVLYGTPGLRLVGIVGTGPIRAQETVGDSMLVVSGNGLYRVSSSFSSTLLLNLSTASGPAFIAQAGTDVLVTDGAAGYYVDFSAATWTAGVVSAPGFPVNPGSCTSLDGYFITHTVGTQTFQISGLFDAQTWDAADSAAKEGQNDPLVRVIASYRQLYLIGSKTSEVWQNVGPTDSSLFPFERIQGAFVEQGTPSPATVRDIDGAILWLGQSKVGSSLVWRMQGFTPVRISTHAQELAIDGYARVDDAYGWTYQDKGHAFYMLSFPTAGATWCFDITTQLWHERPYRNTSTGAFEHHRGAAHAFFAGLHVVGDRSSGNLYDLDRKTYSDNGAPLVALRASPHVFNAGARGYISLLEFFMQPGVGLNDGVDPQAMLRISKDGGRTFDYERTASIGRIGEGKQRVRFNRVSNARDSVIELSISDPVPRVLIGANIRIS
jgi:hypothetical protein